VFASWVAVVRARLKLPRRGREGGEERGEGSVLLKGKDWVF